MVGYIPPAILTELRFDLRHCTFDVTHNIPAGHLTLALGHVQVHCNLVIFQFLKCWQDYLELGNAQFEIGNSQWL